MSCGRSVSGKHIHLPAIYFFRLSPVSRSSAVGSEQKISFGEAATWIFCSLVFLPLVCLLEIPGGVEEWLSTPTLDGADRAGGVYPVDREDPSWIYSQKNLVE
jgi:hypothetical protein